MHYAKLFASRILVITRLLTGNEAPSLVKCNPYATNIVSLDFQVAL